MTLKLKGMTWSHSRGYDPMVATSRVWARETGTQIEWDKRSLQDFESYPVEELARAYDLIVVDHPHVGQVTAEACLAPLDVAGREAERASLIEGSIGGSYQSYAWEGHQWAFPIDAAAQVQAFRPDLLERPAATWQDVIDLAGAGRVVLPMRAPHSLMTFFTLAANLGHPCRNDGSGTFIARNEGIGVYERLQELVALIAPEDFDMDPIAALEAMAGPQHTLALMPYGYGYVSYALEGFRPNRVAFCDIPAAGGNRPVGSALGGTGIAVSAFSGNVDAAIDYAYWIASAPVQKTLFAQAGGQPAHAAAWADETVNTQSADFYRSTRATLDAAYTRPRHNGYMTFQDAAAQRLNAALLSGESAGSLVDDLNVMFARSV